VSYPTAESKSTTAGLPGHSDRGEHPFATRQQLALRTVKQLAQILPDKRIRLAFDGVFATKEFFRDLQPNANAVSRLRKNAALYNLIPPAPAKRRGRPRKRGTAPPPPGRSRPTARSPV